MSQEQFDALLPIISADLVAEIAARRALTEQAAIRLLYHSGLYAALEQEDTKLWQYSTPTLYALLEQELDGKSLAYPHV